MPADSGLDRYTYLFGGIRATGGDIRGFAGRLSQDVVAIDNRFLALCDHGWRGTAADRFLDERRPLFDHLESLVERLQALADAVEASADSFEVADILVASGR